MFKVTLKLIISVLFILVSHAASAEQIDTKNPYNLVKSLGEKVFEAVAEIKSSDNASTEQMETLIEDMLMPYIDVPFASYKVLGSQLKKTNKEQRQDFIEAMKIDLIKTYSSALEQYDDQYVTYEPSKDTSAKKMVSVKTILQSPNAPNVDMTFKLRKNRKTGDWRAYDLVVEGISLIDSKRAELAKPLRDKGVNHVIALINN